MKNYTASCFFIDANHPEIVKKAVDITHNFANPKDKAIALFYAVRDGYYYNPYYLDLQRESLKASHILHKEFAYCVEKAVLLAALLRAVNIPSRLHFGDVTNHIATEKIVKILKTNRLVFHACTEVYLNNKWIKITPAFNKELCEKIGVPPLDFDGENEAIFQKFDNKKNRFMEYLSEYGTFEDLPYDLYLNQLAKNYPHIVFPETKTIDLLSISYEY